MGLPKEYTERCLKRAVKKARPQPLKNDPGWSMIDLHPYVIVFSDDPAKGNYICHTASFRGKHNINTAVAEFPKGNEKKFLKGVVAALVSLPLADQAAEHGAR